MHCILEFRRKHSTWNIKRKPKKYESVRDIWDTVKCVNIHANQVP